MTSTRTLKIWTIITHAIIVIGIGHGIAILGFLEFFWIALLMKEVDFSWAGPIQSILPLVGLLTLSGQILLLISIFNKHQRVKMITYIIGLILFWLSIILLIYDMTVPGHVYISIISIIPFVICTIITFAGQQMKRLY